MSDYYYSEYHSVCNLPSGVGASERGPECNIQVLLLIPFIVSHLATVANHLLLGRRDARSWMRFWRRRGRSYLFGSSSSDLDYDDNAHPWKPWGALCSVALTVLQAAAMALLIRSGGLDISVGAVTLLYLTQPRVGWVVVFLSSTCLHAQLSETATDVLFQECLQALLAIPSCIGFLTVIGFNEVPANCDPADKDAANRVLWYNNQWGFLLGGVGGLIACAAFFLGVAIAMLWVRTYLRRSLGGLAVALCLGSFLSSWFLWIGKLLSTGGQRRAADLVRDCLHCVRRLFLPVQVCRRPHGGRPACAAHPQCYPPQLDVPASREPEVLIALVTKCRVNACTLGLRSSSESSNDTRRCSSWGMARIVT